MGVTMSSQVLCCSVTPKSTQDQGSRSLFLGFVAADWQDSKLLTKSGAKALSKTSLISSRKLSLGSGDDISCSLGHSETHRQGVFETKVTSLVETQKLKYSACVWVCIWYVFGCVWAFPGGSAGKESACNAGDLGSIPGLGRSLGEGKATHSSILA